MRDFKRLQEDPPTGVSAVPTNNNIMLWNAIIFGPSGSEVTLTYININYY